MKKFILEAPELKLLKGAVNSTPLGNKVTGMEFLRTKLSIDLLNFVLDGNYEAFTECQSPEDKLSLKSFYEIQTFTRECLQTDEDISAMEAYLLINDLGKVVSFVEKIEEQFGLKSVDHDELLYEGLKRAPELSPTFTSLKPKYKNLILNGLKTKFNMGQFVLSENLPASLTPLKTADYDSIYFYMIHVLYDIGGAAGHIRSDGSLVITESYWKSFKMAYDSILPLIKGESTEAISYTSYLKKRAVMLSLKINSPEDIAIIKICNMLTINNSVEANLVKQTYLSQPSQVKELLDKEFSKLGIGDCGILLYYAPATLANAIKGFSDNSLIKGLNLILPIFASIFGNIRAKIHKDKINCSVCIAFISDVAEKAKKPEELGQYYLDFKKVRDDFSIFCKKKRENIIVPSTDSVNISGSNILLIALGGGSDCIQATVLGKTLFPDRCRNVISIRTSKTGSQNEHGEIDQTRKIMFTKKIISKDVYLCDSETMGEGRFFENLPDKLGFNSYLIIDRQDGKLPAKISKVLDHIYNETEETIDTILGVDTGGDCLYPKNYDERELDQDRISLEAIKSLESENLNVFNCIIAPGIDSPDGITTEILKKANAELYTLTKSETDSVLELYSELEFDGRDIKHFGKTALIWQAALKKQRGLVVVNIPIDYVLSETNPWIPLTWIDDITEKVIFMKTKQCIESINNFDK